MIRAQFSIKHQFKTQPQTDQPLVSVIDNSIFHHSTLDVSQTEDLTKSLRTNYILFNESLLSIPTSIYQPKTPEGQLPNSESNDSVPSIRQLHSITKKNVVSSIIIS